MRFLIVVLMMLVASNASATCQSGNEHILSLIDWSATAQPSADPSRIFGVDVTLKLKSEASAPIRMIDGTVWFSDALGGSLGGIAINRDLSIAPKQTRDTTHSMAGFTRLLKVDHADIVTRVAVCGVIYADGSKEEFK